MQLAPIPGTGIDRVTGQVLAGWPHVKQSLETIFTTRFGERVMRRWFGSGVPQLLGNNLVPSTILRFCSAICVAVELWEPRYRVTQIVVSGNPEAVRAGHVGLRIDGVYLPRGHLGDGTPAPGVASLTIGASGAGVVVD
jgi:phage baseplate assembly protein W